MNEVLESTLSLSFLITYRILNCDLLAYNLLFQRVVIAWLIGDGLEFDCDNDDDNKSGEIKFENKKELEYKYKKG